MGVNEKYEEWLQGHIKRRTGERRDWLRRRKLHAESAFAKNVWWPLKGHYDHLHPEYEIRDWRKKLYYADFAWLPGHVKVLIEVKGFVPHVQDSNRTQYKEELNRELFLQSIGYRVLSFAYDDVAERPEQCIDLLRINLSRFEHSEMPTSLEVVIQREIIRYTFQIARPIRPVDVQKQYQVHKRTAINHLQALCAKGWLSQIHSPSGRVVAYELTPKAVYGLECW
jgi:very-short-patch-repair endonuclease